MLAVLKLFAISVVVVHGIKLPGSCPKVPPTHNLNIYGDYGLSLKVYVSLPFPPERPSNLFKEIKSPELRMRFQTVYIINDDYQAITRQYTIELYHGDFKYFSESIIDLDTRNETYTVQSVIIKRSDRDVSIPSKCHKTTTENIRIWFEGCYVIIWSCEDKSETDNEHDEALLLIASQKPGKLHDSYCNFTKGDASVFQDLLVAARKHLSEDLLATIDWSPDRINKSGEEYDPFACSLIMENLLTVIIVVIYIIYIGLLAVILWYDCKRFRFKKNLVLPFVN